MDKKNQKLFEQREAVQYLVEDSKLACIELNVRLRKYERYLKFGENRGGIQSDIEPSIVFAYVYEELYKKHLVEMEYFREKNNLNYLMSKVRMLWQK